MNTGTVKFFDESKGFGFIKDNVSSNEYYVQSSGCIDSIKQDDNVQFDLRNGPRGLTAINVKLI
jgi:CspA family cold shock protein